jgi:hypothetical protein
MINIVLDCSIVQIFANLNASFAFFWKGFIIYRHHYYYGNQNENEAGTLASSNQGSDGEARIPVYYHKLLFS